MKRLSEVCKIAGVTRKQLRGYKDLGLLVPQEEPGSKYWLYSDMDLIKLRLILLFTELGYTREEIKPIVNFESVDLYSEYKKAITLLKEKRKRLDGMIELLNTRIKAMSDLDKVFHDRELAPSVYEKLIAMNTDGTYAEQILQEINSASQMDDEHNENAGPSLAIIVSLLNIDAQKDKGANDIDIQNDMDIAVKSVMKISGEEIITDDDIVNFCDVLLDENSAQEFKEEVIDKDEDGDMILKFIEWLKNNVSIDFLKEVISVYRDNLAKKAAKGGK